MSFAVSVRYTLLLLMADLAATALILSKISLHVSGDRLVVLILFYNIVSVGLRCILSVAADCVSDKHTGVRLFVMLLVLGFFWPVKLGVDPKVVLAAIGSAGIHSFAASSVQTRGEYRSAGIGFLAAGAALGTAVARYAPFFGYFAAILCMILVIPPVPNGDPVPFPDPAHPRAVKKKMYRLFLPLLFLSFGAGSYLIAVTSSALPSGRKNWLILGLVLFVGRAAGGFFRDRIGGLPVFFISLIGGTAVMALCPMQGSLPLIGIWLLSLAVGPFLSLIGRMMPRFPGVSVSLAAAAAYLGTVVANRKPSVNLTAILLIGVLSLVVIASCEILLIRQQRSEIKQTEGAIDG